jgi:hypothetical protein
LAEDAVASMFLPAVSPDKRGSFSEELTNPLASLFTLLIPPS